MKWRGPFGGGAASGKAGAMVASRAKSTQYIRARVTPVNPNSVYQRVVRDAVKALSSLWQTISGAQRDEWNVYGANVTVVNALGDAAKRSGFNWFVGNNTVRKQFAIAPVLSAPVVFDQGNPDWSIVAPIATLGSNTTSGTLTLTSQITGCNGTNGFLAIYCSRPQSAGKNFFNGPFRAATTIAANASGNITAGAHAFALPFTASNVGSADSQNFMDYVLRLDRGDGRLSSKFQGTFQ